MMIVHYRHYSFTQNNPDPTDLSFCLACVKLAAYFRSQTTNPFDAEATEAAEEVEATDGVPTIAIVTACLHILDHPCTPATQIDIAVIKAFRTDTTTAPILLASLRRAPAEFEVGIIQVVAITRYDQTINPMVPSPLDLGDEGKDIKAGEVAPTRSLLVGMEIGLVNRTAVAVAGGHMADMVRPPKTSIKEEEMVDMDTNHLDEDAGGVEGTKFTLRSRMPIVHAHISIYIHTLSRII